MEGNGEMMNFLKRILGKAGDLLKVERRSTQNADRPVAWEKNDFQLDFKEVYEKNLFKGTDSVSGRGARLDQTVVLSHELPLLLERLKVKTFLDIPCGDFKWMRHVDLKSVNYIGGDIVKEIAELNQRLFGGEKREFRHLDLTKDKLPQCDAVFCRDCLVHLTFKQAIEAIDNIKASGATYFLSTTFPATKTNDDLRLGSVIWRPLNLQLSPFNFPEPVALINEECTEEEGRYSDKSVGAWAISKL